MHKQITFSGSSGLQYSNRVIAAESENDAVISDVCLGCPAQTHVYRRRCGPAGAAWRGVARRGATWRAMESTSSCLPAFAGRVAMNTEITVATRPGRSLGIPSEEVGSSGRDLLLWCLPEQRHWSSVGPRTRPLGPRAPGQSAATTPRRHATPRHAIDKEHLLRGAVET